MLLMWWCCCCADAAYDADALMLLMCWCCWFCWWTNTAYAPYTADVLMLLMCWCCGCADAANTADELIQLMLLILLMCLCYWCCWFGLSDFSLYCDHCHQIHHSIYVQVVVEDQCVLKKWLLLDSHGALGVIHKVRNQFWGSQKTPPM